MGNGAEPRALDPHLVSSVGDSNIMSALFEGLVSYHPTSDKLSAPGVAERWESNEEYTEWTFHLRNNAKWSNGDPVTAHDFVYAYHRILSPDLVSPYASMLNFLVNAEEFNKGDITDFTQVGVKAPDDLTLICTLRQPTAFFPEVVKHTTWLPVHKGTIEKFGKMTDKFTLWQRPGNHVSNGPFKLKYWRINQVVKAEPNPYYWDRKTVKLKEIHFLPIVSEFTEERSFRDRQMHITYQMPPNMVQWYRDKDPKFLSITDWAGVYFFRCNVGSGLDVMKNVKVRRALALALDRQKITENVTMGGEKPAYGFAPPMGTYDPPKMMEFNPEEARRLLAEAGYPDGKDFPELVLKFNTLERHRSIAEAVQDMWKTHLNLDNMRLENQEWKVYQKTMEDMDYQLGRAAWIADYLDPTSFLDMWRSGDTNNYTGWANPTYDKLLREAALQPSEEARNNKLREAETVLLAELPIIPLYWYSRPVLKHPDLKNWDPLLLDKHPYKHLDVIASGVR
jgi:oligopeptide transport system substrate-binding protein